MPVTGQDSCGSLTRNDGLVSVIEVSKIYVWAPGVDDLLTIMI